MINIYEKCITLQNTNITLRQTKLEDAEELLKCYSDEKAVPFFNADNCNGDNFHYKTIERMEQAIDFWDSSYKNRWFVRWTIIYKETKEIIGTIEMFNRCEKHEYTGVYGIHGILRIDLQSNYEVAEVIESILSIASKEFGSLFAVEYIATKALPEARERIKALKKMGYTYMDQFELKDYYGRKV
jgi:ribosomal-protein-alanine N-acetyltransferase